MDIQACRFLSICWLLQIINFTEIVTGFWLSSYGKLLPVNRQNHEEHAEVWAAGGSLGWVQTSHVVANQCFFSLSSVNSQVLNTWLINRNAAHHLKRCTLSMTVQAILFGWNIFADKYSLIFWNWKRRQIWGCLY